MDDADSAQIGHIRKVAPGIYQADVQLPDVPGTCMIDMDLDSGVAVVYSDS